MDHQYGKWSIKDKTTKYDNPWIEVIEFKVINPSGNDGIYGLNYAMCSKSCCSPQYPTPFNQDTDVVVDKMKGEFAPNSYKCNNAWQDSGCLCMTNNQKDFLTSRGGNCGASK